MKFIYDQRSKPETDKLLEAKSNAKPVCKRSKFWFYVNSILLEIKSFQRNIANSYWFNFCLCFDKCSVYIEFKSVQICYMIKIVYNLFCPIAEN